MSKLSVKVCGIRIHNDALMVNDLGFEWIGFNFYPGSPRFTGELTPGPAPNTNLKRVGVFVNEPLKNILSLLSRHSLDAVQLHGDEPPMTCGSLRKHTTVIKAFGISETFDFKSLEPYMKVIDFFLFDTKTQLYGGSGKKYNWDLLKKYTGEKPFFISGGIKPDDISQIKQYGHAMLYGIDINSGFETSPGIKNIEALKQLARQL